MDADLRTAIESHAGVVAAPEWAAAAMVTAVVERFGIDPDRTWWWESLPGEVEQRPYDEDGLAAVASTIAGWGTVVLIVTEEDAFPPATYLLTEADVVKVLGETHFFEYALVSPDLSTLVFDTHHNQLVIARR